MHQTLKDCMHFYGIILIGDQDKEISNKLSSSWQGFVGNKVYLT